MVTAFALKGGWLAGCIIVHLPLTTVRVCIDSVGVGQVCYDGCLWHSWWIFITVTSLA